MRCPVCGYGRTVVVGPVVSVEGGHQRTRKCRKCGESFTTTEVVYQEEVRQYPWEDAAARSGAADDHREEVERTVYADALGFLGGVDYILAPEELKLDLVHLTCAPPWERGMGATLKCIATARAQMTVHKENRALHLVETGDDLQAAFRAGKTAVVLGLQQAPSDCDVLRLKQAGVRILALAQDEKNEFGSGWENAGIGLKDAGRTLLEVCAHYGMIVDFSHAGHRTAREALRFAQETKLSLKVMASHGGCFGLFPHFRNLPDDVLKKIIDQGGVVGIYTLVYGLHQKTNTLTPFKNHLKHALRICGEHGVVIGGDGNYIPMPPPENEVEVWVREAALDPDGTYAARYPDQPIALNTSRRMEVIAEMLGFLKIGARRKILGLNLFRFLAENLPG